jgi:hypothetical protein
VASIGGADHNPPWFLNVVANPDVRVELQGDTFPARATVLSGQERDRLFAACVALLPEFGDYQQRTRRILPVVYARPESPGVTALASDATTLQGRTPRVCRFSIRCSGVGRCCERETLTIARLSVSGVLLVGGAGRGGKHLAS